MTETDRVVVLKILKLFRLLVSFMRMYTMPKEVGDWVSFFVRNMERLEADESLWKDEHIAKDITIDDITKMMATIVWTVMDLTRDINTTRSVFGRVKINFTEKAIEEDKEKKTSQQQRAKAGQERQD